MVTPWLLPVSYSVACDTVVLPDELHDLCSHKPYSHFFDAILHECTVRRTSNLYECIFPPDLSAFLRRIDLVTNLVAPIVTGQVITYGSSVIGAVFMGGWTVAFMFIEYGLLYAIYRRVPDLAVKTLTGW